MIMDDRFIQHPVLKWRHHLQDPVQFIEVIPNAIPDCEDTVVVVSGSQHHETHCYQYNNGEYEVRHTFPLSGNTVMNPPLSTVLPWKVSLVLGGLPVVRVPFGGLRSLMYLCNI
jgi:hypothetical protein